MMTVDSQSVTLDGTDLLRYARDRARRIADRALDRAHNGADGFDVAGFYADVSEWSETECRTALDAYEEGERKGRDPATCTRWSDRAALQVRLGSYLDRCVRDAVADVEIRDGLRVRAGGYVEWDAIEWKYRANVRVTVEQTSDRMPLARVERMEWLALDAEVDEQ